MNIDVLSENREPPWMHYFYIAIPLFIIIMLAVLVLKHKDHVRQLVTKLADPIMKCRDQKDDLEK
jgi:hypothetical protein